MSVDSSPVKFIPARPGQPAPDIAMISGGRPVFRAELPDGRIVWLVSGYETVRQMIIDQRFSRAQAVAPGRAAPDRSVFIDPDRFDVTRDAASHLAFGAGVHHCLGAQLARVELQEAFRGLIGRLPGLRLAVPVGDLEFKPGMAIHSLRELPVRWGES